MRTSPLIGVHVERARVERLHQQIAVDGRERQLRVRPAVGDRDAAGDGLDRRKPGRAFEREVAAHALHADLAFDVRHPDVARDGAEIDRRVGGHLHVELDVDAARRRRRSPCSTRSSTRLPVA